MYKLYTLSPNYNNKSTIYNRPPFFYGVVSDMFYLWYSYVYDYCH